MTRAGAFCILRSSGTATVALPTSPISIPARSMASPLSFSVREIDVRIELSSDRLAVTIADDGIPFNPFSGAPPDTSLSLEERELGGLGIHVVSKVMDEVSYNRRTDRNVVILVKYLDDSSER